MITVQVMIDVLSTYNPDATFQVVVDNYPVPFRTMYGGGEGCTSLNCSNVSLHVGGEDERNLDDFNSSK